MPKTDFQLATEALKRSSGDYRRSLLASGGIREAVRRAMGEADPLISQVRSAQGAAQQRLGTVFADSMDELKDITDPAAREKIRSIRSAQYGREASDLGGRLQDLGATRDTNADKFASIFGATTQAKQFDVSQQQQALDRAFQGRFDDLTRREKEANIAASNRSNRTGPGNITFEDQVANPLLAFLAAGGKRVQDKSGGYGFFDAKGNPITVEQAAAMVPGGTKSDFLAGSQNKQDAPYSGLKLPSAAAKQQQINQASGMQSLSQLEELLNGGISEKEMLTSKTGLSSLFASNKAKQYRDAARNIADIVARIRTGAQINEKEMDLYLQFVPGPSDTPAVRKQKIATLKTIFGSAGVPDVGPDAPGEGGIPGI